METTTGHPDGVRWESHPLANPNLASRYHTMQMLFCVNKVGKNATTYWWKIWGRIGTGTTWAARSRPTSASASTTTLRGLSIPTCWSTSVLMKDRYPGLQDFCKKWFKGPEGKVHKKEAEENDAWILRHV